MENYTVHIVSCSGASNTGKYSDAVARMLMAGENAKMLCLARFSIVNSRIHKKINLKSI